MIVLICLSSNSTIIPIHFDEAQYATWKSDLSWGYATKGPLITFVHYLFFSIPDIPLIIALRLPAWIIFFGSIMALNKLACLAGFDRDKQILLLLLVCSSPIFLFLGLVHTTDVWLIFFWLTALVSFCSIVVSEKNSTNYFWWMIMGVSLGLGALAKISIALLPLSLIPWVVIKRRKLLLTFGPYLGAVCCFLILSPWITWNYKQNLVHFHHEISHVFGSTKSLFDSVSWIPILILSSMPITFFLFFFKNGARSFSNENAKLVQGILLWSFFVTFTFFILKGLMGPILINWLLPLVPSLFLFVAIRLKNKFKIVLSLAVIQVLLFLAILNPYTLGIGSKLDVFAKLRGWEQAVSEISNLTGSVEVVTADHYSKVAWLLLFWPSDNINFRGLRGQTIPTQERRINQYDLLNPLKESRKKVAYIGLAEPEYFFDRCSKVRHMGDVVLYFPDGEIKETLSVWNCFFFNVESE